MRYTATARPTVPPDVRDRLLDLGFYLVCTAFAALTAGTSEFFDYRMWGALSLAGYLFGLGQSALALLAALGRGHGPTTRPNPSSPTLRWPGARRSSARWSDSRWSSARSNSRWSGARWSSARWSSARWPASRYTPIGLIAVLGMVVPLVTLVITRTHQVRWSEQPEVWVVERSTSLLLRHGTPYTDLATLGRPPVVNDYTPYGPVMTVFGLPRVIVGASSPFGDARLAFAVAAVVLVALALRIVGRPSVPIRALQLAIACPLTALTWSVAGDDLAIVALTLLALALLHARRPVACAAVITVAVSMKLTAVPALLVLGVAVLAMLGWPALGRFLATVVGLGALLNVPVLLVDPGSFVEHVIKFPVGLGRAHSPAASPLPGNLIARLGPVGHTVSLALLMLGGLAMAWWLLRRPPRTTADAARRIAVGLAGAIMLAPATRYGYLVYPVVLLGAALTLRPLTPADGVDAGSVDTDRVDTGSVDAEISGGQELPQFGQTA